MVHLCNKTLTMLYQQYCERCVNHHPALHDDVPHCHNCGAAAGGKYCAACGQSTRLHVASAAEFIHEFIGHYVALEGRLWQSLKFLLLRPGFLTAEYIAGRRVRYVEPLRLYLTFSLLFFALFKLGGVEVVKIDPAPPAAIAVRSEQTTGAASSGSAAALTGLNPSVSARVNALLNKSPQEQSRALTTAFFSYAPYAGFCLMPLFAFFLKLLYLGSGKRYGEHLLFALHANAFAFLILGAAIVLPWGFGQFVLMMWMAAYLPLAMQRVYGGRKLLTALRWIVLSLLHMLSLALALAAAFGMALIG